MNIIVTAEELKVVHGIDMNCVLTVNDLRQATPDKTNYAIMLLRTQYLTEQIRVMKDLDFLYKFKTLPHLATAEMQQSPEYANSFNAYVSWYDAVKKVEGLAKDISGSGYCFVFRR